MISVECGASNGFKHKLVGGEGFLFEPRVEIGLSPWFSELKAGRGNFGLGFGAIKCDEIIKALNEMKDHKGAPYVV